MFGLRKSSPLDQLPEPPSAEAILEDLKNAGPDDVVFTVDVSSLSNQDLSLISRDFKLAKRFEVIVKKATQF